MTGTRIRCRRFLHAIMLMSCCASTVAAEAEKPHWSGVSRQSLYRVDWRPKRGDVEIGVLQSWILTVKSSNGEAVFPARISVGGGMQSHGHGLPTQPLVTAYGGGGEYLVEGVRFSMEGQWRLSFIIESSLGSDRADIDLAISY